MGMSNPDGVSNITVAKLLIREKDAQRSHRRENGSKKIEEVLNKYYGLE